MSRPHHVCLGNPLYWLCRSITDGIVCWPNPPCSMMHAMSLHPLTKCYPPPASPAGLPTRFTLYLPRHQHVSVTFGLAGEFISSQNPLAFKREYSMRAPPPPLTKQWQQSVVQGFRRLFQQLAALSFLRLRRGCRWHIVIPVGSRFLSQKADPLCVH